MVPARAAVPTAGEGKGGVGRSVRVRVVEGEGRRRGGADPPDRDVGRGVDILVVGGERVSMW